MVSAVERVVVSAFLKGVVKEVIEHRKAIFKLLADKRLLQGVKENDPVVLAIYRLALELCWLQRTLVHVLKTLAKGDPR